MNITGVILYFLGALVATTVVIAWFFTSFPLRLTSAILGGRRFDKWPDWLDWIRGKSELAAELFGCPICFSFWVSLFVSSIIVVSNHLTPWFVPSAAFGWPTLVFFVFKRLSR